MWLNKRAEPTRSFLLKAVNDLVTRRAYLDQAEKPSYFVTGLTGRKGDKKIGSLPLLAAGELHLPNIIIKAKGPVLDRERVFLCAIKDLDHVVPYDIAFDLMKPGNGDKLLVLHIFKKSRAATEESARFKKYFDERMQADGIRRNGSGLLLVEEKDGEHIHDVVIRSVDEAEADYLVIYPSVTHGRENTKHTVALIEGADCNIVVCNR